MEKIYLNYPYLTELTTKTKEKWVEDDELHVIFEQTLFFADENVHIEQGKIDDIPVIRPRFESGSVGRGSPNDIKS